MSWSPPRTHQRGWIEITARLAGQLAYVCRPALHVEMNMVRHRSSFFWRIDNRQILYLPDRLPHFHAVAVLQSRGSSIDIMNAHHISVVGGDLHAGINALLAGNPAIGVENHDSPTCRADGFGAGLRDEINPAVSPSIVISPGAESAITVAVGRTNLGIRHRTD